MSAIRVDQRTQDYVLRLAEIAGTLAAIVEWCIEHDGECLGDNPHQMKCATEVLADARAHRDAAP